MTDETVSLSLNIAALPRQKPKPKPEPPPVPIFEDKPVAIKKLATSSKSVQEQISKKQGSSSVWKAFKKANKSSGRVVNAVKSADEGKDSDEREKSTSEVSGDEHWKSYRPKAFDGGRQSSLFENNPEIPKVVHKCVRPLQESVFSDECFADTQLHPFMVKYLDEVMSLTKMTMVQQKSIPVLLEKKDALIKSQTGSGKTLAFVLPVLHHLQEIRPKISRTDGVLVLVVVPTRELALQTYELFNKLVKSYTWIVPGYLAGGEKRKSEKARLRKGISVLIGTPGRLVDHLQNTSCLSLEKVSWLVLDEADRLFDMGYEKDVSNIIATLDKGKTSLLNPEYINPEAKKPEEEHQRHTILLSATLTPKVMQLAGLSLRDPVFVDACEDLKSDLKSVPIFESDTQVEDVVALPQSLVQLYMIVPAKLRLVMLTAFILWKCKLTKEKKMLVFIATQDMVDYHADLISTVLSTAGDGEDTNSKFSTSGIEFFKLHGSMNQKERTDVFNTFRKSDSGVLFCTDVAARGLDLPEVDWIVQYTGPSSVPDYVHRVGRTARGGHSGSSVIFLLPSEIGFVNLLEDHRIRLAEEKMDRSLKNLWAFYPDYRTAEEAASGLQSDFEEIVAEQDRIRDLGSKAYASWCRFYSCYPRAMKSSFNMKVVHQGHLAKSFALREAPSDIIRRVRGMSGKEKRSSKERPREWARGSGRQNQGKKPGKMQEMSEFDSGLEPLPKRKRN